MGIAYGILTRAESHQDRIEPYQPRRHHDSREDHIHHDHIAQHTIRLIVIFLPQIDSQQR